MRNFKYILVLFTTIAFSQVNHSLYSDFLQQYQKAQFSKTIIDYGATAYTSKKEALKGKKSSHTAIRKMLDEHGVAILPAYGWFYFDETTILWRERDVIYSLGKGNRGVNLVTDKPVSMFLITNNEQEIKGFTAWYIGKEITKQCAVVQIGGDARNIGAISKTPMGKIQHFRPRRTNAVGVNLDFDFVGDERYSIAFDKWAKIKNNPNYIKNYGAYSVWVNFDEENEHRFSHFQDSSIKGRYRFVNTGLVINKKDRTQSINSLDVDVKIRGARQFLNVQGIDLSKIKLKAQHQFMVSKEEAKKLRTFELKNSSSVHFDRMEYDRSTYGRVKRGLIDVENLKVDGYKTLKNLIYQGKVHLDADLSKRTSIIDKK